MLISEGDLKKRLETNTGLRHMKAVRPFKVLASRVCGFPSNGVGLALSIH